MRRRLIACALLALTGCASVGELQTRAEGYPSSWLCVASVGGGSPTERSVWRAEVDRRGETCERFAAEMTIEANRAAANRAELQRILSAPPARPVDNPLMRLLTEPRQQVQAPPAPSLMPLPSQRASWTGRSQPGTSVTGRVGYVCEYSYFGRTFTRMFEGSCPSTIEVQ